MTKKQKFKIALELLNNGNHQACADTQLEAIQVGEDIVVSSKDKTTSSFFHLAKVTEVANALTLSAFARVEDNRVVIVLF